jgi:hypothetical protein
MKARKWRKEEETNECAAQIGSCRTSVLEEGK